MVTGIVASGALLVSNAFFSDTETSTANTFQAGKLDLLVNGQNDPEAIVKFEDLKPGDNYIEHKTLYIDDNPGYVWLHLTDLVNSQGTQTEPEEEEEAIIGPKSDLQNYLEFDLTVNGNVLIAAADHILLPDVVSCWIPLGEIPGAVDVALDQSFHFDSAVTNWAQGDILTFTEEFFAVQSRNNPNPAPPPSTTGRVWSSDLKKCVSDLSAKHNLTYTCVTGCSGTYPHTINISSMDTNTGNFSGTGFYNPNPAYTWNVTGNTSGVSFTAQTVYTGLNPGYTTSLTGTIDGSGNVSGTAGSGTGQTFTFIIN